MCGCGGRDARVPLEAWPCPVCAVCLSQPFSLGLGLHSSKTGPSSSSLVLRALAFLQGTNVAWMWTSVPHGRASMEAAARTCPTASSATVRMATQVPGADGHGGGGRSRARVESRPGVRRFLWLMHGGCIDGDKERRKDMCVLVQVTAKRG